MDAEVAAGVEGAEAAGDVAVAPAVPARGGGALALGRAGLTEPCGPSSSHLVLERRVPSDRRGSGAQAGL